MRYLGFQIDNTKRIGIKTIDIGLTEGGTE